MMRNRRRHSRRTALSPVFANLGANSGGILFDLGEAGVAVDLVGPAADVEVVAVGFELPHTSSRIEATGQIVWKNELTNRVGLRFVELPDSARQQIKDWVALKTLPEGAFVDTPAQPRPTDSRELEFPLERSVGPAAIPPPVVTEVPGKEPVPAAALSGPTQPSEVTSAAPPPPEPARKPEPSYEVVAGLRSALLEGRRAPRPKPPASAPPPEPTRSPEASHEPRFVVRSTLFQTEQAAKPKAVPAPPPPEPIRKLEASRETRSVLRSALFQPEPTPKYKPPASATPSEAARKPGSDYEVLTGLRTALQTGEGTKAKQKKKKTQEEIARQRERMRKLARAGAYAVLVLVAFGASAFFYRSQRTQLDPVFGDIKQMIAGVIGQPSAVRAPAPTPRPETSKPRSRRRGDSKVRPGEQATRSAAGSVDRPAGVRASRSAKPATPFQFVAVEGDERKRVIVPRGGPVVQIKRPEPAWPAGPVAKSSAEVASAAAVAPPAATAVPTSSALGPERVNAAQPVAAAVPIEQTAPAYPAEALDKNVQGRVVLRAMIGKDGAVQSVRLVSGPTILASAVMDAVRQWRYTPYYRNGEPIEVETQITVDFIIPAK